MTCLVYRPTRRRIETNLATQNNSTGSVFRKLIGRWLRRGTNVRVIYFDLRNSFVIEEPASTPPPIICVDDRALLQYAVLNDSVGYNSGHGLMFVGGREIGKVPCLAIYKDKNSPRFMLYHCGSDWSLIGMASYDSVAAAKRGAERIYPGSSDCWVEAQFTEEDAKRFLDERFSDARCSFCGKRPDETVSATFEGDGNVRICSDCVRDFYSDLNERSRPEN